MILFLHCKKMIFDIFKLEDKFLYFIFLMMCVCCTLCYLPLMSGSLADLKNSVNINLDQTMKSIIFVNCVVGNIAVSLPYVLEYIMDLFITNKKTLDYELIVSPKLFFIISLLIPNLGMLVFSIPTMNKDLFVSLFSSRFILLFFGFVYHIYQTGGSYFKSKLYCLGSMLLFVAFIFLDLVAYTIDQKSIIYYSGFVAFGCGCSILFYLFFKWKKSLDAHINLTISERNCLYHIIVLCLFIIISTITILIKQNYAEEFCIVISCTEGGVAVFLILIENRSAKLEMLLIKDVCLFFIYNVYLFII